MVNSQHQYQLLQRPFPNFRAFSLKNDFYWLLDSTNVRAQLFPHRQFSLYFLMNIETTRLQQSIIFNLYSIATYNKHLFTIILIIHVFAIFHHITDMYFIYIHLFCFAFTPISIEISLHIDASLNFYYFCQRHLIMNN